jgi:uncharacterized membrane protein YfcA
VTTPIDLLVLFGVGILAGIVSVVASLASIVSYPALLALGLPPVAANVTNTVALMFTGLGAAAGSRPELVGQGRRVLRLGLLTAVGGGVGATLLLTTPSATFEYAAPLLIAAGSIAILRPPAPAGRPGVQADPADGGGAGAGPDGGGGGGGTEAGGAGVSGAVAPGPDATDATGAATPSHATDREHGWLARLAVFAVAVYIGYFGAAGGIMLLAVLIRLLQQSLAKTNAVKNVVSGLANAVAGLGFAIFGPVRWAAVVPLAAGFLIGGWTGPAVVRRLPARALRVFVGCAGLGLALWLGARAYG